MSKKKSKKRTAPAGRGRVVVLGGVPKMSEVILDLADPLLDGDVVLFGGGGLRWLADAAWDRHPAASNASTQEF